MLNSTDPKSVTMQNAINWLKWDFYIGKIKEYSKSNERKWGRVLEGYEILRDILGDKFIETGHRNGHPFVFRIANFCQGSLLKNGEFGLKIGCIARLPGFKKLIKEPFLRGNDIKRESTEAEIEVIGEICRSGYPVELLESPDFKFKPGDRWIYAEISTFQKPDKVRVAEEMHTSLSFIFLFNAYGEWYSVNMDLSHWSSEDKDKSLRLKAKIEEVIRSSEEFEGNYLNADISVKKRKSGSSPASAFPTIENFSYTWSIEESMGRVTEKLSKKAIQLKGRTPAIIMLYASMYKSEVDIAIEEKRDYLIGKIRNYLTEKLSDIDAVVLTLWHLGSCNPIEFDKDFVTHICRYKDMHCEHRLIVMKNRDKTLFEELSVLRER